MALAVLVLLGARRLFGGGQFVGQLRADGYAQTGLNILKPLLALPVIVLEMLPRQ
jgi:hypothetical protein